MTYKNILEILEIFGLEDKEAKIYLALIELGKSNILQLSKKAGIERTSIYYILQSLKQKRLVRIDYDLNNILYLSPVPPGKLLEIEKHRYKSIQDILPELKALYHEEAQKPRIQLHEGIEAMDMLYNDIFEVLKHLSQGKREYLQYASADQLLSLPAKQVNTWRKARISIGGRLRFITTEGPTATELKRLDKDELRETRILSTPSAPFGVAMAIYGNKVAQFGLKGEFYVLIIDHKEQADMQRTIFELAWQSAKD